MFISGVKIVYLGRVNPFYVSDYPQKADSRSFGKGTKIIAEIQIFSQRLITEFFFRSVHHTNDLIEN